MGVGHLAGQVAQLLDRLAVVRQDHVTLFQAGRGRRAVGGDVRDQGTLLVAEIEVLRQVLVDALDRGAKPAALVRQGLFRDAYLERGTPRPMASLAGETPRCPHYGGGE